MNSRWNNSRHSRKKLKDAEKVCHKQLPVSMLPFSENLQRLLVGFQCLGYNCLANRCDAKLVLKAMVQGLFKAHMQSLCQSFFGGGEGGSDIVRLRGIYMHLGSQIFLHSVSGCFSTFWLSSNLPKVVSQHSTNLERNL